MSNEQAHQNQTKPSTEEKAPLAAAPRPLQDSFPRPLLATPGLNKREYFAGLAMMGMMDWDCQPDPAVVANYAVAYADALLAKLDA